MEERVNTIPLVMRANDVASRIGIELLRRPLTVYLDASLARTDETFYLAKKERAPVSLNEPTLAPDRDVSSTQYFGTLESTSLDQAVMPPLRLMSLPVKPERLSASMAFALRPPILQ